MPGELASRGPAELGRLGAARSPLGRHRPTWGWGHPGRPLYDNQLGHRLPTGGPAAAGQLSIVVAIGLFLLSPVTLLAWAAGQAWLRVTGLRWWKLALASVAAIAAVVMVEGGPAAALGQHFSGYVGWLRQIGAAQLDYPAPGAFLWPQLPLAIPVGLLVAALNLAAGALRPSRRRGPGSRVASCGTSPDRLGESSTGFSGQAG